MFIQLFAVLCAIFVAEAAWAAEPRRITPADLNGARQPQVAITDAGSIHVVFGKENSIYATRSQEGSAFDVPVRIGELEKLALGMRRGPRIAATAGSLTVAAISHADGNLHAWSSRDGGRSWSEAVPVNSIPNSAREGMHALASDGKSKLAAVWLDLRSGKTELWSSLSLNGGQTWEPNTRVYRSPDLTICECCHPSAIFTSSGELVVMWRNWLNGSRDMYQAISQDGGRTFSPAARLGTGTWKLQACPMDGGSLAASEDQTVYVWRRDRTLFVTSDNLPETVLTNSGTHPIVFRTANGFAYIWQDQGRLYLKGHPTETGQHLADGAFASVAWNARQKRSVLVWEDSDAIYALTLR
jgi:hypothetical protein